MSEETKTTGAEIRRKPQKPVETRESYLAHCKQTALDHTTNKGLMVFYIRKKKPNISTKVPFELADEIKNCSISIPTVITLFCNIFHVCYEAP